MTDPDNIPDRVTQLEVEMREVRVLAVGADQDVSTMQVTLRAHISTLNALRQTQLEHGQRLDQLDQRFDRVDARFDHVDGEFSKVHDGMAGITALLTKNASEE